MEESDEDVVMNEESPIRKLALFSLPPHQSPAMPTPPFLTSASVPFHWEEAPGKPRHSGNESNTKAPKCVRSLELPPRLLEVKVTNMPSPTTVLDGPEVGRALSFSYALRSPSKDVKGGGDGGGGDSGRFGSTRWAVFRKNKEEDGEGSFDFLGVDNGGDRTKVKMTRVKRKASFFSGASQHSRSHMWANIYESLKQVVPWRRRQEKLRKSATIGYEPQNCAPIPTC